METRRYIDQWEKRLSLGGFEVKGQGSVDSRGSGVGNVHLEGQDPCGTGPMGVYAKSLLTIQSIHVWYVMTVCEVLNPCLAGTTRSPPSHLPKRTSSRGPLLVSIASHSPPPQVFFFVECLASLRGL